MASKLEEARKIINAVDTEMARLFTERMRAAEMVAEHKRECGLEILDKVREDELIRRNSALVEDPIIREYYVNFLKNTMAVSRSYQARLNEGMSIAYCGTEGAFAHIAAERAFPYGKKISFGSFDEAYLAVVNGECDAAMLPIENSSNGEVGQVTDLMFSGTLYVNGVSEMTVKHDLVAKPGVTLADIKTVISHPQALGQCHGFIRKHGFGEQEYKNTALAAEYVRDTDDMTVAAIASAEAAEKFGLTVLMEGINDVGINTTRFGVFSRSMHPHPTSEMGVHSIFVFTVRNEAGALAKAIDIIGKHGFNMRTLRSRPMKELLWQYYFYVEAEGNIFTDEGRRMLAELDEYCDRLKAIGTYSKA